MKPNRRNLLKLALSGSGLGAAASAAAFYRDQPSCRRTGVAFDTSVALTVVGLQDRDANLALDAGFAEIRRLEQVASLTRPGSDICRLNASCRLARPDPALLDMLGVADQVHRATEGAFDVTLLLASALYFKFFCRFICPLGGVMSIGGKLRLFDWIARRAECGKPCQLCKIECQYDAIKPTGEVRYDACFQCLDCVAIYHDAGRCVPVVLYEKRKRTLIVKSCA